MRRGASAFLALSLACGAHETPDAHRPSAFPCEAHGGGAGPALDQCTTDQGCAASSVCACFPAANAHTSGNVCSRPGNCRVDGDCPSEEVCSPSYTLTCAEPFQVVYACHTGSDQCENDSDCAGRGATPGIDQLCTWQPRQGVWGCVAFGCNGP